VGSKNAEHSLRIFSGLSLAFFDKYLKGIDSPLLAGALP
jgi:hypothetical protein